MSLTCQHLIENDNTGWWCYGCSAFVDRTQVSQGDSCAKCEGPCAKHPLEVCGSPAVIRYDGRNLCKDCADKKVLALVSAIHAALCTDCNWWDTCYAAVDAVEPKP